METVVAAKGWVTREAEAAFVELMNVGNRGQETVEEAVAQLRQDMAASSAAAMSGINRARKMSSAAATAGGDIRRSVKDAAKRRMTKMAARAMSRRPQIPSVIHNLIPAAAAATAVPEPEIRGYVHPDFEPVVELFAKGFRDGSESEAQLCVYHRGEKVIDVYGLSEPNGAADYDEDTLQIVYSSSKVVTSVVFACLIDRGLLSYDDLVSDHWPEFAQNGKGHLKVCDVLRHECGLVTLGQTVMFEDMLPGRIKENSIGSVIEAESMVFPPEDSGTDREYHGLTRGWILNEIFRRVEPSGRTIGEFLREEISGPLCADAFIGLTPDQIKSRRIANVSGWKVRRVAIESMVPAAMGRRIEPSALDLCRVMMRLRRKRVADRPPVIEDFEKVTPNKFIPMFNRPIIRMGEVPSGNAHCSARGMARIGAAIVDGGSIDGVRIMGAKAVEALHDCVVSKRDHGMTGMITDFSQGGINFYRQSAEDTLYHAREKELREGFCGWMGFGGSVFQWNRERGVSFAYTPTLLSWYDLQNLRGAKLQKAVTDCAKKREEEASS